jgi:hypothetical protein
MNFWFRLLCISLLVCGYNNANSQQSEDFRFQAAAKVGYGFIMNHSPSMEYITNRHVAKLELSLEGNAFGESPWNERYNFPRVGLSIAAYDFNNQTHLGKAIGVAPHFNFKLLGQNKIQWRMRTGIGLGYVQKPFDSEENFKNIAIGSKLNIYFSIVSEIEIKLLERLGILLGASFSHFSNSSYQKPNLGINVPAADVGFCYRFGEKKVRDFTPEPEFEGEKAFWRITAGGGWNEVNPQAKQKHLAYALSFAREKKVSNKSSIGGSVDFYYNPVQRLILQAENVQINKGFENVQYGFSFYHVLHYGKLESFVQAGYYLQTEDKEIGNLYQLVGGRYNIGKRFNALLAIKTHFAKAEYLMFGLGFKIENR